MQSLTESLHEQEELERCTGSERYRDVHESAQLLGFSHGDPEEGQNTLTSELLQLNSLDPHCGNW